MSNSKFQPHLPRKNKGDRRRNYRLFLTTFLITTTSWLSVLPLLALTPPGTVIDNQATGSFTDPNDNTEKSIESNTVKVTVAEVAGITVTSTGTAEAPSTVTNAGPFQGNGNINPEDIVYFNYKITNVGNDPTQFFIPGAPSSIDKGALSGSIQIIEYNRDGTNATVLTTPINIPASGISTGNTAALGANGSILPNGTVTIRVPIKINTGLNDGDKVKVVMGDTPPNDNSAATQNQVYIANANNRDIYTDDNPDGTTGETAGTPINGDATNHRQEASAAQDVTVKNVIKVSGTLYEDTNGNNTFDTTEPRLPKDITVTLYKDANNNNIIDAGEQVKTTVTDANGNYTFNEVVDGTYKIKVDLTDVDIPDKYALRTPNDLTVTVAGSTITGQNFGFDKKNPNILMVKRITAINGDRTKNPNDNKPLNAFVDDTTSPRKDDDNSPNWKANYLIGEIDAGKVKPGDEIEYTVYYLNAGGYRAEKLRICDRITPNQDFKLNAYVTNRDIQLKIGNGADLNLTSADDTGDRAKLIAAGAAVPANCNLKGTNTNGTVLIDITGTGNANQPDLLNIPGSTAKGTPDGSYGLIRFTTTVKP